MVVVCKIVGKRDFFNLSNATDKDMKHFKDNINQLNMT